MEASVQRPSRSSCHRSLQIRHTIYQSVPSCGNSQVPYYRTFQMVASLQPEPVCSFQDNIRLRTSFWPRVDSWQANKTRTAHSHIQAQIRRALIHLLAVLRATFAQTGCLCIGLQHNSCWELMLEWTAGRRRCPECGLLGFIVSGRPNSFVKKSCVGTLQTFTHMPTHPLASRYLHKPKGGRRWVSHKDDPS